MTETTIIKSVEPYNLWLSKSERIYEKIIFLSFLSLNLTA